MLEIYIIPATYRLAFLLNVLRKSLKLNVFAFAGGEIGGAMTGHPDIRKLGFTGSTEVGHEIMRW